jgi:hypothetical protein
MTAHGPLARMRGPVQLLRAAARRLAGVDEFRLYRMPAARARALDGGDELRRDAAEDLALYVPDAPWDRSPEEQQAVVAARTAVGDHVYTLAEDGRLLHYSWLTEGAASLDCDFDLGAFPLPGRSAKLWDDNTVSLARGRGLHQRSLRRRARDAAQRPDVDWVFIGVRADNGPSRHNIEKVGFEHRASRFRLRLLGLRLRWERAARADGAKAPPRP